MNAPVETTPGTVLARLTISKAQWEGLAPHTRRLLSATILWRDATRSVRLRWDDHGTSGASAWVIAGAPHHREVLEVLAAVGVEPTATPYARPLRRIPSYAIFTDPTGTGEKVAVETAGAPLLARNKRRRWKRWPGPSLGVSWPSDAREDLGAWVAPVVGRPLEVPTEPPRYVVERGTPTPNGRTKRGAQRWVVKWAVEDIDAQVDLAAARFLAADAADRSAGTTDRWRVRDLGTGVVRSLWWTTARGGLCRQDFDPARKGKVPVIVVRAAEKKTSKKTNKKGK